MFADLNRHAVRPSRSLGLLYDHRDERVKLTKLMVARSALFKDFIETERSTLSMRSRKLFTLSAVHTANKALIEGLSAIWKRRLRWWCLIGRKCKIYAGVGIG